MTRTRSLWVAVAVLAAVLASTVLLVQRQAAAVPPATPGETTSPSPARWSLAADGVEIATATSCSGFGSSSAVVEYDYVDKEGRKGVSRQPGAVDPTDVTCTFPLSTNRNVYDWRQLAVAGSGSFRRNVTLSQLSSVGTTVQTWRLSNAWPSEYLQAHDRVVVVLTHEGASWL